MELLTKLKEMDASQATLAKMFGDFGEPVRGRKSPQYDAKLAEAVKFVADVKAGTRPMYHFREALSTSDFPYLFADILDRQLLARYRETPVSWSRYSKRSTVPDFRLVKRFVLDGAEAVLAEVPQPGELPMASLTDSQFTYGVKVYGRRLAIDWAAMVNDDLNAFSDVPDRLGRAARRTEEKFVTGLYVDANGPHASVYTGGNGNIITGNPELSLAALQLALGIILTMKDTEGEPIMVDRLVMVVPPQLQATAYNVINAVQIWAKTGGGGTTAQELLLNNWVKSAGIIDVVTDFYIPIIATTNGDKSWFIFADPTNNRPAIEVGFLQGFEEPGVFKKASNIQRLGGGLDPRMGDFDTLANWYSVVHVVGGTIVDPKMTVASNGSGS